MTTKGFLAILGGLFASALLLPALASLAPSSPTRSVDAAPVTHRVEYNVTGAPGTSVDLTYENADGGTEQRTVKLPFNYAIGAPRSGQFFYISAQIADPRYAGSITVTITLDGATAKTATAEGFPHIASVGAHYF